MQGIDSRSHVARRLIVPFVLLCALLGGLSLVFRREITVDALLSNHDAAGVTRVGANFIEVSDAFVQRDSGRTCVLDRMLKGEFEVEILGVTYFRQTHPSHTPENPYYTYLAGNRDDFVLVAPMKDGGFRISWRYHRSAITKFREWVARVLFKQVALAD